MKNSKSSEITGSDMKAAVNLVVSNRFGIHARPAALLVKTASMFKADVTIEKGDMKVSGKSIMGLMTLEAGFGCTVRIVAAGEDAVKTLEAIRKLFEQKFFEE